MREDVFGPARIAVYGKHVEARKISALFPARQGVVDLEGENGKRQRQGNGIGDDEFVPWNIGAVM